MKNCSNHFRIAYLLLTSDRPLSTREIADKIGCNRRTVYSTVDELESAGFVTDVIKGKPREGNMYSCQLHC